MKKLIFVLLALCLVLAGCSGETPAVTEATQPVTDAAVPETEAPTEAPTEYVVTEDVLNPFTEPTEPVEEEPVKNGSFLSGGSWVGLIMIAGVITVLLAGAMIFRGSKRNRY